MTHATLASPAIVQQNGGCRRPARQFYPGACGASLRAAGPAATAGAATGTATPSPPSGTALTLWPDTSAPRANGPPGTPTTSGGAAAAPPRADATSTPPLTSRRMACSTV